MSFITELKSLFQDHTNPDDAFHMKKYMKDQFEFYGIKATQRRQLLKQAMTLHKDEITTHVRSLAHELFAQPERELHHCGMELFEKILRRSYLKEDIDHIEKLITTNSWWDTVDFISKQILGTYLMMYPEERQHVIPRFSEADNIWLNRSTILFQLAYKEKTDENLLFKQCKRHKESEEFFIRKAIGWALREYGKTSPKAVLNFVNSTTLKPLSRREAIRNIIK